MKINQNIYPYNIEVRKLPIHLTGIGGSEYQYHVVRPEGYHWHQILFSVNGNGTLRFDNLNVVIDEGDYFFLPAGYPHEYYSPNNKWEVYWLAFDGYATSHILSQLNMTKPAIIKPGDSSALQNLFSKMFTAQQTDRLYGDFSCSGYAYECLLEFHRLLDQKANKAARERSKLLTTILDYIDEHFRTDFPLTALAEYAGITPQHLCRIFKSTMNIRPNEYLTKRRLQESKRLLQKSTLPISEIALQSGFPDAGYFSTVFKRYEGLTPMEYKKHIGVTR